MHPSDYLCLVAISMGVLLACPFHCPLSRDHWYECLSVQPSQSLRLAAISMGASSMHLSNYLHHCLCSARASSAYTSIIVRASSVHPSHYLRLAAISASASLVHLSDGLHHCLCSVRASSVHPSHCLRHCLCLATIGTRVLSAHPPYCLHSCLCFAIISTRASSPHDSHGHHLATINCPL